MESQRVNAVSVAENEWIDDVALGLAHLSAVTESDPAVTVNLLRERFAQCHKDCGPDEGVESYDLLSHDMHVSRPVLLVVVICIVHESHCGDIVRESVDPDVNDVLLIECYRDTPCKARPGNAEILKSRIDEVVYHLVDSGLRIEEVLLLIEKEFLKFGCEV